MQFNSRSGQSLLVIVLLIAVVFTLIASASYRLTTETQSARIQEDTIRTLAAADSGIEKGLQLLSEEEEGTFLFSEIDLELSGVDPTKSTIKITTGLETEFVSPLVAKDEQYTFYLYNYPDATAFFRNSIYIHYGPSSGATCSPRNVPTLEITLISGVNNNVVNRWISEPCVATDPQVEFDSGNLTPLGAGSYTVDGQTFTRRVSLDLSPAAYADPKLLIVRPLFSDTRLGFQAAAGTFSEQGRTITAEAVSTTGISKIVTLFRSNPQIPADFFVTTF